MTLTCTNCGWSDKKDNTPGTEFIPTCGRCDPGGYLLQNDVFDAAVASLERMTNVFDAKRIFIA